MQYPTRTSSLRPRHPMPLPIISTRPSSLRRASDASTSSHNSISMSVTGAPSPAHTINAVLVRQPSIVDMEAEKRRSGTELSVLEPRPIVYWGGLEERLGRS